MSKEFLTDGPKRARLRRKVYTGLSKPHTERCNFGCKHSVTVWHTKYITLTDEKYEYNNGYSVAMESVWVDYQGRKYYAMSPMDFYGSMAYRREDGQMFLGRPHGEVPKDVFGNLLKGAL